METDPQRVEWLLHQLRNDPKMRWSLDPKYLMPANRWAPLIGSQRKFLKAEEFEVLYEGTRGPGKTAALLMDFGQFTGRGYGAAWKGILFRQTYPQLADVISKSKQFFHILWPQARYNEGKSQWEWPGGEMLAFRQFMRDDDYWNYHGHEYPWIGWEELCNWPTLSGYLRMMSCCRSATPGLPRHYRATTNPYGPGHNVVKRRFRLPGSRGIPIVDAVDADGKPEPARIAIHGFVKENTILLEADPDYIQRLRASARNKAEADAWLEGSWDIVAGGMFDDVWDHKIHVVPAFDIPHSWRMDRSFDWGSSKPFSVGWWAESDGTDVKLPNGRWRSTVKGDLFRIYEWYGCHKAQPNEGLRMLATEIANGIVERELAWKIRDRVRAGPADNGIYSAENGVCIATDMAKRVFIKGMEHKGVTWYPADKSPGSRKTGWEKMRQLLKQAIPQQGLPREKPGLFFFDRCVDAINLIPVAPRSTKPDKLDDLDTESEDHICDEVRYRVRAIGGRVTQGNTIGGF